MAHEDLIPMNKRTKEEQKRIATAGGIASGEARRRKRSLKQAMELLLSRPLKNDKLREQIQSLGIEAEDIDNQMAMAVAQFQQALKGNTKAYVNIEATLGEKPKETIEISHDTNEVEKEIGDYLCQRKK